MKKERERYLVRFIRLALFLVFAFLYFSQGQKEKVKVQVLQAATGPLRVHPENPRYFTDGSGKAIFLTGSHTWSSLRDGGPSDPPAVFDYDAYLDFMVSHHHNFIRFWSWGEPKFKYSSYGYTIPQPWLRTGPGNAADGKPKFDLGKFNQAYFDRLRERVLKARSRGIYVSVMLFEGHCVQVADICWEYHPFNKDNNVDGVEADVNGMERGLSFILLMPPVRFALSKKPM